MKRWISILLISALLLGGCADNSASQTKETSPESTEKIVYHDGVIGGRVSVDGIIGKLGEATGRYDYEGLPEMSYASDGMTVSASKIGEMPDYPGIMNGPEPQAGLLTAREWSDRLHIMDFHDYLSEQKDLLKIWELSFRHFVEIQGLPALQKVRILAGETLLAEGVSDINGYIGLALKEDAEQKELILSVEGKEWSRFTPQEGPVTSLSFESTQQTDVTALDFMLMVDTTGSMGDELEYLKKELQNVIESVYKLNPHLSIRVSVNFYRDEGDEYVVKYYDFREDVQEAVALIEAQHANGGGDTPEAVHTALDNAVFGHHWREEAVKLCYLVLDAPPHRDGDYIDVDPQTKKRVENINDTLNSAINGAAAAGIRIIPVVASGGDNTLELLGRSWAFLSGGTYIYLTNDSGIGYWHETPEVPETTLEYLNDCMIRITAQYCGLTYEAERMPEPSQQESPIWQE